MIRQEQLFDFSEVENAPAPKKASNHCNNVGAIAEHAFQLHAAENGFTVFVPIGHAQSVDVVIQEPGCRALTVQIKQAQHRPNGVYRIPLSRSRPSYRGPNENGVLYKKYQPGEFDIVAGYIAPLKSFWLAWLDDVCGVTSRSIDPSACALDCWSNFKRKAD